MLVCIPKDIIKPYHSIQKNIIMDDVLSNIKFYESEEKAEEDNYMPISTCVTIRSTYSNLVVAHNIKDIERYYITITNIPNEVYCRGDEMLAFLSSLAVTQAYDPLNPIVQDLMLHTKFLPIGILYLDEVTNPYFYSQVIFKPEYEEPMKDNLKEGYRMIPIKEMNTKGNLKQIVNEIFEIKGEEND